MARSRRLARPSGRGRLRVTAVLAGIALLGGCAQSDAPPGAALAEHWQLLDGYCSDCHNDTEYAADLSFESAAPDDIAVDPETWEKVVRKLRGDLMPPPGGPRPDGERVDAFVASLETSLDAAAATRGPMPGHVAPHRLNRTEYARAIEDLFGIRIDAQALLPQDIASEGFDNIAEVLSVSPTHLDQYLAAARDISIRAVGEAAPDLARADYRSDRENRTTHVAGLPLGTRGGLAVEHYFPADGDYGISLNISSTPGSELRGYPYGWLEYRHRLVVTIDGVKVFEDFIGGEEDSRTLDQEQIQGVERIRNRFRNIRVNVTAGEHVVGASFVARSFAEGDYLLSALTPGEGVPDVPRLYGLEIIGPYNAAGIGGLTASRDRIFLCHPSEAGEERPCAREILENLAYRAFRRPVDDEDIEPLLGFYDAGRAGGGDFQAGIQKGVMAVLASTKFLYRTEPGDPPAGLDAGAAYVISDLELAWRLAFFLWSHGPDETLLALAERGELGDPEVLRRQVERMLADPRSDSLVTNFAFQWLDVRRVEAIDPDPRLYPNFDEDLRRAFRQEMEHFLDSILREERSVLDLLTANHTFVNERLARHYGIDAVRGDQFRRVQLDDPRRFGLFGKASVLMVTSYPDRTSPVLRGAWIMDHILATPPASVPAGVETDLTPAPGDIPRTVRERLVRHRTEPSCNHCHGVIDPLGQALENFNVVGEWRERERENGLPIDSSGELASGTPVNDPAQLRRALAAQPELFVQALTEKLMTYALGRGLEYYDLPTARAIVAEAAASGYSFRSIVLGIAASDAFRMRAVPDSGTGDALQAQGN